MSDDEIPCFAGVEPWARLPLMAERKLKHDAKAAMRVHALDLRRTGMTVAAIAKELGLSASTITRWTW